MPTRKPANKKSISRTVTKRKKTALKNVACARGRTPGVCAAKKKVARQRPAPQQKRKPPLSQDADLPRLYNKTCLRLLPRDPEWLFAYWEICPETIDAVKCALGEAAFEAGKPVLRINDITDRDYDGTNAWQRLDIDIHYYATSWYVRVPESGRTVCAEYGVAQPDGSFYRIALSNAVSIPRDGVSEIIDEEWSTVNTDELIRFSSVFSAASSAQVWHMNAFTGSSGNLPAEGNGN